MVVSSLIKNILPIAVVGLGLAFLYNVVAKPAQATASAGALGQTLGSFGAGLSSIGGGAESFLGGIGRGSAKLLDPLFSLKTLVYGDSTAQIVQAENIQTASNTTVNDPIVNASSTQLEVSPDPGSQTIGPEVREVYTPPERPQTKFTDGFKFLDVIPSLGDKDPTSASYTGTQQERVSELIRRGFGNDVVQQWSGAPFGSLEYIFNTGESPTNPAAINSVGGNSSVLTNVGSIYQGPIYPSYANPDY